MTVPGAIKAIEKVADALGDKILLGAGTVLDPETLRVAQLAGARFFVTPNLRLSCIEMAHRYSTPIMPGALTPTEVITAWENGADIVKVFPAGNMGGAKYIKSLKGPFPQVRMIPTGGVSLETAADFLRAGSCAIAVGGELVSAAALKNNDYAFIENTARQFVEIVRKTRSEEKGS